jgi:hypothetical protein
LWPFVSVAIYIGVAIAWLIPDRRFVPYVEGADRE